MVVALPFADHGGRRRWLENKHKIDVLCGRLSCLYVEGVLGRKALLIITCLPKSAIGKQSVKELTLMQCAANWIRWCRYQLRQAVERSKHSERNISWY